MSATIGTPVQRGVSYDAMAAPLLKTSYGGTTYHLIPVASSCSIRQVANGVETESEDGDTDNFGTGNHHLVYTGDFKMVPGISIPVKGDVLYDDAGATGNTLQWVITGDPEFKSFGKSTGAPMLINLELKHWPKVAAAIS